MSPRGSQDGSRLFSKRSKDGGCVSLKRSKDVGVLLLIKKMKKMCPSVSQQLERSCRVSFKRLKMGYSFSSKHRKRRAACCSKDLLQEVIRLSEKSGNANNKRSEEVGRKLGHSVHEEKR